MTLSTSMHKLSIGAHTTVSVRQREKTKRTKEEELFGPHELKTIAQIPGDFKMVEMVYQALTSKKRWDPTIEQEYKVYAALNDQNNTDSYLRHMEQYFLPSVVKVLSEDKEMAVVFKVLRASNVSTNTTQGNNEWVVSGYTPNTSNAEIRDMYNRSAFIYGKYMSLSVNDQPIDPRLVSQEVGELFMFYTCAMRILNEIMEEQKKETVESEKSRNLRFMRAAVMKLRDSKNGALAHKPAQTQKTPTPSTAPETNPLEPVPEGNDPSKSGPDLGGAKNGIKKPRHKNKLSGIKKYVVSFFGKRVEGDEVEDTEASEPQETGGALSRAVYNQSRSLLNLSAGNFTLQPNLLTINQSGTESMATNTIVHLLTSDKVNTVSKILLGTSAVTVMVMPTVLLGAVWYSTGSPAATYALYSAGSAANKFLPSIVSWMTGGTAKTGVQVHHEDVERMPGGETLVVVPISFLEILRKADKAYTILNSLIASRESWSDEDAAGYEAYNKPTRPTDPRFFMEAYFLAWAEMFIDQSFSGFDVRLKSSDVVSVAKERYHKRMFFLTQIIQGNKRTEEIAKYVELLIVRDCFYDSFSVTQAS